MSKSEKTNKKNYDNKTRKIRSQNAQRQAAQRNRPVKVGELETLRKEVEKLRSDNQECWFALSVIKFAFESKFGINQEEMIQYARAYRMEVAVNQLTEMARKGMPADLMKHWCLQNKYNPADFVSIIGE